MQLEKRHLLIVIAIVCLVLWYYGSENIPYLNHLGTIGGLAYALSNLANLAKQPSQESVLASAKYTKQN